ncbi:hypothetical protein EFO74_01020 [Lacticaseibacillus rhamnosus]|nr:hypothetical protein [Lacticaseibacillus rhamnosus]MCT3163319.1 hypothetical protein [Lacticaseibacillus rhamnosus]MCT3165942.1 hypothetical protein [Lacticaseibacillus rhamnosus]MCT3175705.1 hypothetical protein [Lacticaseibacillus rhamnosus]
MENVPNRSKSDFPDPAGLWPFRLEVLTRRFLRLRTRFSIGEHPPTATKVAISDPAGLWPRSLHADFCDCERVSVSENVPTSTNTKQGGTLACPKKKHPPTPPFKRRAHHVPIPPANSSTA